LTCSLLTPRTDARLTITPAIANLTVGETLQLTSTKLENGSNKTAGSIAWKSSQPSRATVTESGLVKAVVPGEVKITANRENHFSETIITIEPVSEIYGLDFPGNAGVKTTMRFEFTSALAAYPATYIWRVYPRQQQSYYTTFFWGNNGAFFPSNTYYGFHPYPDWNTAYQHFWEIAAPPGGDTTSASHIVYDRWYIQVAVCKKIGNKTVHDFYWDWPDQTKMVRYTTEVYEDPPFPVLIVGDAPWNQGNEVWDGILRGLQFYDFAMTPREITSEISFPGSVRKPWYLNLNPTPLDISDKSGSGKHPKWVGTERPSLWIGTMNEGIIKSVVSPR
jgi:hypothetical protein